MDTPWINPSPYTIKGCPLSKGRIRHYETAKGKISMSETLTAFQTAKTNLLKEFQTKLGEVESLKAELMSVGFTEDDLKGKAKSSRRPAIPITVESVAAIINEFQGKANQKLLAERHGCNGSKISEVLGTTEFKKVFAKKKEGLSWQYSLKA
jgi:hypothetical protein